MEADRFQKSFPVRRLVLFGQNRYLTPILFASRLPKMKSSVKLLLPVLALCWVPAHADTILYTDSGTFAGSTATGSISGKTWAEANDTWAFSFEADSNPAILESGAGGFNFAFSDFRYYLEGSIVSGLTPDFIRFFSGSNGGGFEMCFNGTPPAACPDGLGTYGAALYTGMTSSPTLSTGTFTSDSFIVNVGANSYEQPNTTLEASAVPEPSTLLLTGICFLGILTSSIRRKSVRQ